jgi:Tfp pilus assembly protein PilO
MTKGYIYLKKIIINCAFSAVIVAGMIFGFIFPAAKKLAVVKKEISAQKIALEKIYIRGQNLRKISEDLEIVEPNLKNLKKMFIKEEDDLDFITSLEKTAENSGVKQNININYPAENNKKTSFQKIPLQLTASGNFLAQIKYLTALESLDYYISVRTLEISGSADQNQENALEGEKSRVDMQLTANTYWQK